MKTVNNTYDIFFNDDNNSNNKGFKQTLEYCTKWVDIYNGSNYSYFEDVWVEIFFKNPQGLNLTV